MAPGMHPGHELDGGAGEIASIETVKECRTVALSIQFRSLVTRGGIGSRVSEPKVASVTIRRKAPGLHGEVRTAAAGPALKLDDFHAA